ncbi:hypothetical protein GCM10010502_58070 [Kitasatospora aureofaciens]|uniref:Uncharacterized protein n=1 Tax=Kitasatospora aureofaciens TaxID=1894 RepID=A0A8H9LUS3_KITAU|nr:hypothetical protein GCM10010502_58070 [Kitasatospora aureofaciens]
MALAPGGMSARGGVSRRGGACGFSRRAAFGFRSPKWGIQNISATGGSDCARGFPHGGRADSLGGVRAQFERDLTRRAPEVEESRWVRRSDWPSYSAV